MARTMRLALLLLPVLVMTTACRFVEQQKDIVARVAAFGVLRPVLAMQSSNAALTQGTFRDADAVAAKGAPKRTEIARASAARVPAATPRPVAPVIQISSVEIDHHVIKAMRAVPAAMPSDVAQIRLHEKALRVSAMAEVRSAIAVARCEVELERERQKKNPQQARRKIVVIAPNTFEIPASAIELIGQGS